MFCPSLAMATSCTWPSSGRPSWRLLNSWPWTSQSSILAFQVKITSFFCILFWKTFEWVIKEEIPSLSGEIVCIILNDKGRCRNTGKSSLVLFHLTKPFRIPCSTGHTAELHPRQNGPDNISMTRGSPVWESQPIKSLKCGKTFHLYSNCNRSFAVWLESLHPWSVNSGTPVPNQRNVPGHPLQICEVVGKTVALIFWGSWSEKFENPQATPVMLLYTETEKVGLHSVSILWRTSVSQHKTPTSDIMHLLLVAAIFVFVNGGGIKACYLATIIDGSSKQKVCVPSKRKLQSHVTFHKSFQISSVRFECELQWNE